MKQEDNDDDFIEIDDDDASTIEIETISLSPRSTRQRRTWRDIERLREQKEIDRLLSNDDWYDELDRA